MILSIIIPAYNAERYVDRCMSSIFHNAPNEESFEVIVVNDGSMDRTAELMNKYCTKHSNVILINKENEGVSVARNVGIESAKGEYVLFLDVDDELINGSLKKVCDYLTTHEAMDMLVTLQSRFNGTSECIENKPPLQEHKRYSGVEAYREAYIRTNAGGGICRRKYLKDNNLTFPAGVKNAEDTIFFGHLQVYAKSIVYYSLPLYRIIEAEDSASRSSDYTKLGRSHLHTMRAVAEVKKSLNGSREQRAIFDSVVYQLLSNTIAYFVNSNDLNYKLLKQGIDIESLFPLDIHNMYIMRGKARIMNCSLSLFYFLSGFKHKL